MFEDFDPIAELDEGGALLVPADELDDEQREILRRLSPDEVKQLIGIAATVRAIETNNSFTGRRLNSMVHV
ncbi:MAG: hypothetical protein H0T12_04670 [Actinobacteria bacterium]|nr:hypothetical protein [Actinomycetota bacterium]